MLYAYIFLGAGILILSILFRLAAVFRLTIPLLYALVVPTLERRRREKEKEEILIQRMREAGRNGGGIVHIDDLQD